MFELSLNNIEQTIEELLELEEKIMKIIRKKLKKKVCRLEKGFFRYFSMGPFRK